MGYHYFWAMFWDQKVSQKEKQGVVGLEFNQILTLNFTFDLTICVPLSYTCWHSAIWVNNFDIHWYSSHYTRINVVKTIG